MVGGDVGSSDTIDSLHVNAEVGTMSIVILVLNDTISRDVYLYKWRSLPCFSLSQTEVRESFRAIGQWKKNSSKF